MRSIRLPTTLLTVLNVALVLLIAVLWSGGQTRVKEPETLVVPPLTLPDLSALSSTPMHSVDVATIRNQAVFYASRSFYEPPDTPVEIPAPSYELAGTMRLRDGKRLAFVKGKAGQPSRTLHVADELDGWRVQAIEVDRVTLGRDEQTAQLSGTKPTRSSGLVRGPATQRVVQTGIRVLTGTDSAGGTRGAIPSASRPPRLYQPPPQVGK